MNPFLRKKSIDELQNESTENSGLKRVLGLWQLTAIGLGGIIGVGIFVLTGVAAAEHAGPAVILSFMIAGLASAAAALCYAEFAGLIPVAGSAYTYSYAVLGEGAAWLIGWDLLLEYTLVIAVVAIGWSGYMQEILTQIGIHLPVWAQGAPGTGAGHRVDLISMIISLAIAGLLTLGMEWGARFNNLMVIIKLSIVLVVIVVGAFYIEPANWHPFMPFGFHGVMGGAALVFFAVFGYDTLTTAAEESKNPQRDLPRAVVFSLGIALCLYIGMSLVITGMAHYDTLNNAAPIAKAFSHVGLHWITFIISVAAIAGILSVLFSFMLAGSRIWFSMSRDGLLPKWFAKVHTKYKTPYRPTLIIGAISALVSGLTPISEVAELVNIGTLSAFILICSSIMVLRKKRPELERKFRTPFVPVIPLIGIGFSIYLIISLPPITWIRFVIWMVIGLVIYLFYGRRKSKLTNE
ncbi:amino acid permease [Bacillus sp. AFS076308]|uniref:amino acid permease n=1 Tax=unclassified Bacillus (in: firmicutes) TaxID=185979 RepID=UPI000BF426AD|nr:MULTISPECIES: amino acid permease [unclassified Bacillus (in: firmicutes)]PFO09658.1 amino acid permease [Bacillus sp. AFS076308]PGV54824.1 amino acid permease [Bacillus sp. AFS037270]